MSVDTEQAGMVGCGFGTLVTVVDTTAPAEKSALRWIITNLERFWCILFLAIAAIITNKPFPPQGAGYSLEGYYRS